MPLPDQYVTFGPTGERLVVTLEELKRRSFDHARDFERDHRSSHHKKVVIACDPASLHPDVVSRLLQDHRNGETVVVGGMQFGKTYAARNTLQQIRVQGRDVVLEAIPGSLDVGDTIRMNSEIYEIVRGLGGGNFEIEPLGNRKERRKALAKSRRSCRKVRL